jgi:peptidoglycan/xylan/chitin deacetylase (PgdA/CDA1 family)
MHGAAEHTVCLTFDFDALSVWLGGSAEVTPATLSRGEYGARVGVPRILELLKSFDIRATFFVPGHTADSFPERVEAILDAGHEVAHHGYSHRDPSKQSAAEERRDFERATLTLQRFLGHQPEGFRSPSWDYSGTTLQLLIEHGIRYDSSLFAGDFHPYHPRIEDQVSTDMPLRPGRQLDLWEFPVAFCLDDWAHFAFNFDPLRVGLSAPSKVFEIWAGEYDHMVTNELAGVFTITMHPQIIGRGHRIALLERLIRHIVVGGSAQFARMGDVAKELSAGAGATA